MSDGHEPSLASRMGVLDPKTKQPNSASVLNSWIAQAESKLGPVAGGGRLSWLIASSVAIAAVQRAVDSDGRRLFLLKGGTLLQHRLDVSSRATKDVDGLIRGDIDEFLRALDGALGLPWGPFTLRRGEVQKIVVPARVLQPRRFDVYLELRGVTWRRIQFEISPDEAGIGAEDEQAATPRLSGFGLPDPDALVGIALRYQIAQKLHAVTDPHDPPRSINDRPRDVVDLLLLRDFVTAAASPTEADINAAADAVFASRALEAAQLGLTPRTWPATIVAHPHWRSDFVRAASSAGVTLSMEDAVDEVNYWVRQIASTSS